VKFWQAVAFLDTDQLIDLARISDDCGYHGMMVSDHLFYPEKLQSPYPYSPTGAPIWDPATPWPDPWVVIGAMAAVTTHLRFTTNIYIAPARNPFVVAKAVGTAAVISRDRVALGVAAGWMREEFEQLGEDFATRGRRLDEMVEVLRTLWQGGWVEHHGTFYDFDRLQISPVPSRPVPIYGGGHSDAALRRAARLDGWIGNAYPLEEALDHVRRLTAARQAADSIDRPGYEVIVGLLARPDVDLYRQLEEGGVTGTICAPWMTPGGAPSAERMHAGADFADKRRAVEEFAERIVRPLS
jgi:probable F420-dependent oxidoreductase